MSLTLEERQKLSDKGFDALFTRHKGLWLDALKVAFKFYRESWGSDAKIRPEDLAILIALSIKTAEPYRAFVGKKQIAAKQWSKWFADLIVEELYTDEFATEDGDE